MSFASDNWAGASDQVIEMLAAANADAAPAYGNDPWTGRAMGLLSALFEREVAAFFVSTGSAANALALASCSKPGGVVFAHVDAHIVRDEAGAPLFFSPGSAFDVVDGPAGKIDPDALAARLGGYPKGALHHGRPAAVSITNVNEIGQCYTPKEVAEIAALARAHGAKTHLDGARLMNAVSQLGASPAELSWRAGVDVVSLGLTKTGGMAAEAVVIFDEEMAEDTAYRHKQTGQLLSKNRFAAVQFVALLEDDHALSLAAQANAKAAALGAVFQANHGVRIAHAVQSNEVFVYLAPDAMAHIERAAITFAPWSSRSAALPPAPAPDWTLCRFVASFRTTADDVDAVAKALRAE